MNKNLSSVGKEVKMNTEKIIKGLKSGSKYLTVGAGMAALGIGTQTAGVKAGEGIAKLRDKMSERKQLSSRGVEKNAGKISESLINHLEAAAPYSGVAALPFGAGVVLGYNKDYLKALSMKAAASRGGVEKKAFLTSVKNDAFINTLKAAGGGAAIGAAGAGSVVLAAKLRDKMLNRKKLPQKE